jgi:K+-transporting ATPase ATPase B chain
VAKQTSMFTRALVVPAIGESFLKLDPRTLIRNPVMFVTAIVAALSTLLWIKGLATGGGDGLFQGQLVFWLWLTVLFGNFAESLAEGRGKAQAASLRAAKADLKATLLDGRVVDAQSLKLNDVVMVATNELIPADGEVVEGVAFVNEAAITGESAPVIREGGGDRSAVTAGTRVIADWIKVKITAAPGEGFLDRMIALVEGASSQKTPNEIALTILLAGLTLIFLIAVGTLPAFASFAQGYIGVPVLVALFVTLIPTTISALLSAIGIAGMDRLVRFNVLAKSGRAVEAAGDIDVLLLDKTGTITIGDRQATGFHPIAGITQEELVAAARLASLADETPEGRSIVVLAGEGEAMPAGAEPIKFTSQTRVSGLQIGDRSLIKGAIDAVLKRIGEVAGAAEPFDTDELLARLRVAFRHRAGRSSDVVEAGLVRIDLARHVVTLDSVPVTLSPREFGLLLALAQNADRVVTHQALLRSVWGEAHLQDVEYLRVAMRALRRKLEGDPGNPSLLINEPGIGYRLNLSA